MKKPIRILHVVTTMNLGGLETFIMNLYRCIDREQIQFDFLMHRKEVGAYDEEIESLGGNIYRFDPLKPLNYFSYQSKLKKFFADNSQYSIVHSHINESSALVLAAAKKANIPVRIAHSHNTASPSKYMFYRNILKNKLLNLSTHRFACSNEAGRWLYASDDFKLIKNSISTEKFKYDSSKRTEIRNALGLIDSQILVGNVSRFSHQKNHSFLIKVFAEFNYLHPSARLLLIGNGSLKDDIKKQITELGITDKVIFTGAVKNANEYLSAMDFYLFPSLFEGLPLALVEAQCNGLPSLISDTISSEIILSELITQTSLNESAINWANKMDAILSSDSDISRERYQERIKEKGFDVQSNTKFIEQFYLKLHE